MKIVLTPRVSTAVESRGQSLPSSIFNVGSPSMCRLTKCAFSIFAVILVLLFSYSDLKVCARVRAEHKVVPDNTRLRKWPYKGSDKRQAEVAPAEPDTTQHAGSALLVGHQPTSSSGAGRMMPPFSTALLISFM